jgi:hypothetical protein
MKTVQGFKLRKLGNEFILVGESLELINFNKMITLNATAAFLWQEAEKGEFTVASLTEALLAEYEVSAQQAQADVESTVNQWLQAEVIFE